MGCGAQEETTEVQSVTAAKQTLGWGAVGVRAGLQRLMKGPLLGCTGAGVSEVLSNDRLGFQKGSFEEDKQESGREPG